tara:strand:- start:1995 stop:2552 length:558 start_codon:yes stop_codon:yes gene_type:complete
MKNLLAVVAVVCLPAVSYGEPDTLNSMSAYEIGFDDDVTYDSELYPQVECMALNIYYEARSSSLADQYAVADVVLNRLEDTRYPDTICDVVKDGLTDDDGQMIRNKCQFSWYCDGKDDTPKNMEVLYESRSIAWDMVMLDTFRGLTEGSTHYHTSYVNPVWNKSKDNWSITRVGRIGSHIYYRWN